MNDNYPHIFAPLKIGTTTFKNRIWTAPAKVHLLYGSEDRPNEQVIAYYAKKAAGGAAVITYSGQNMDLLLPEDPDHADDNIFKKSNHRWYAQLTDAIHLYGAKASLELLAFEYHRYDAQGNLVNYSVNGNPELDIDEDGSYMPALPREELEKIAETYADAAENALQCGFDMLLIHGGHGLPLSQFLSPKYNTRTDEFGGSLENRVRFPLMVLKAIRARVGKKLLIEYRISGNELAGEDGFTEQDCVEVLRILQDYIDIAHISCGSFLNGTDHITHPTYFLPSGCNAKYAAAVKASPDIHIPVLTLGGFQTPELIEETLASGKADIVCMARGAIADAACVNKARDGREDEIIPCIRCFHCLDYMGTKTFGCGANPAVGRETVLPFLFKPMDAGKQVVVIGGGPAGMTAAISAAKRGGCVTLIEQSGELGGKLVFSRQVPFKHELYKFMCYQTHMMDKLGIRVMLNTTATPELVASLHPDAVIAALGAEPARPPVPGLDSKSVLTAEECYHAAEQGHLNASTAVVLGGGLVGCETALYLKEVLGISVSLIEMMPDIAQDEYEMTRTALLERMDAEINYHTRCKCTGVAGNTVSYTDASGSAHTLQADLVVLALGMRPRTQAESFRGTAKEFYLAGDCVVAGNVGGATRTGFDAALAIDAARH